MRQAARAYFETQVTTTSQGQILIMLYDGAIKFLNQAKERMEAKDYAGKGKLISNAIDVINELASSLNAEKGGDLATNLNELYFYCNKRLFMANSRMDSAGIDEVIKILSGIRSAYAQIVDSPEAVAAMAQAPTPTGNPVRSPVGTQAGPTGGVLVPKAKAHNAYATQGAARAVEEETQPQAAPETAEAAAPQTGDAAAAVQAELEAAVEKQAVPEMPPMPPATDMPPLDDMPPLTQ
ncbi:flagellar export chaperone FliS, partial [Desulfovibrio sp. OttesenSCG-928-O18]|nr:flagellar export chaperone FliS [Desulfovibrio sp. OttesenSCG-928-O18]